MRCASPASGNVCPDGTVGAWMSAASQLLMRSKIASLSLFASRLSRDEADRWAARWVLEDGIVWDDLSWWR